MFFLRIAIFLCVLGVSVTSALKFKCPDGRKTRKTCAADIPCEDNRQQCIDGVCCRDEVNCMNPDVAGQGSPCNFKGGSVECQDGLFCKRLSTAHTSGICCLECPTGNGKKKEGIAACNEKTDNPCTKKGYICYTGRKLNRKKNGDGICCKE